MLFDIAMPANITIPISDITFKVVPVSHSVIRTPVNPGENASRIMNGSTKDRN